MKSKETMICWALAAIVLSFGAVSASAAETLGDVLRESGWDRLIGTWVGDNGRGGEIRVTYAWRFKDRVAEISSRDGDYETVALVGYAPGAGKVTNLLVDNQGGSGQGEWRLEGDQAILETAFVNGDGQESRLRVRQRLEGNDALTVTIDLREPVTYRMTRAEPAKPADPAPPNAGAIK